MFYPESILIDQFVRLFGMLNSYVSNVLLLSRYLNNFDIAMNNLETQYQWLASHEVSWYGKLVP